MILLTSSTPASSNPILESELPLAKLSLSTSKFPLLNPAATWSLNEKVDNGV